ncbi:Mss4-like protein [Aspergillus pseudodeflectus]|uniref:Mss4-like protein n=1 Tax=Aspergillus pseudodeflectus TaxID=176178 RepID=A0ABR4JJ09_9EURO
MEPITTGGCLCEAVKYALYGKPVKSAVCHCESCQQFSGSVLMANCWFKEDRFKIIRGHDAIQTYNEPAAASGQSIMRSFCRICGSSLFQRTPQLQEAGLISVTSGTMDDRSGTEPTLEIWCRNRRSWLSLDHKGEKYETQ